MKKLRKVVVALLILVFGLFMIKIFISNIGINILENSNIKVDYENEWDEISDEDMKIIKEVIALAKEKEGLEYVWGGKGEIMTEDRLEELRSYYGEEHYPLNKNQYMGKQAFDCSGLTYWIYEKVTGIKIGYSTVQQQDVLKKYKVKGILRPGDLIYIKGHVALYIGDGKVINSKNRYAYPKGGVKIESVLKYKKGEAYRPIDFINDQKN